MWRLMSDSFSSSMNGPVFVNLPDAVSVHIGNPVWANDERCGHREHDDTDGPTVDRDNFRREVVGRPTHCLFRKEGDCACQRSSGDQCEQTTDERTHPEHCETIDHRRGPKSATLVTGGSSFVRSTFWGINSVSEESRENIQPRRRTSGSRSRGATPWEWIYCKHAISESEEPIVSRAGWGVPKESNTSDR
jgi:hypothetical protein